MCIHLSFPQPLRCHCRLPTRSGSGPEAGLAQFLANSIQDLQSEFYLPACIDDAVAAGKAGIELINTDEHWFGLTYQEDRESVQQGIMNKIANEIYPEKLWG